MGVNRSPTWDTLTGKPTTVAGLGLSDFNGAAIGAQAAAAVSAIGSYVHASPPISTVITAGTTYAGSTLVYSGINSDASGNSLSTRGTALTGTWRAMGSTTTGTWANAQSTLFLRIA